MLSGGLVAVIEDDNLALATKHGAGSHIILLVGHGTSILGLTLFGIIVS